MNYSIVFIVALSFLNLKKYKNLTLGYATLALLVISIFFFLIPGQINLSQLRQSYITPDFPDYYDYTTYHIIIRYISILFVTLGLYTIYNYIRQPFMKLNYEISFDVLLHLTIIWITSTELIQWMDMANSAQSYKLGLSILWGVYALFLIAYGIWRQKMYLRIGGMILFGLTLIKLFFYDIAHLNTISKTIVFVALGLLLLIISFLYNKYKNVIHDETEV